MQPFAALRRRRSWLSLFALVALLAAQLALAAYACPLLASGAAPPPPCHQADPESPALCKALMQSDDQGSDSPRATPDFGAALAPLSSLTPPELVVPLAREAARLGTAVPLAAPPPLIDLLGRRRD